MSKHIWDITPQDLSDHSVWQFPMWEDDSCDETIIIPANNDDAVNPNSSIIVKADFTDAVGSTFVGYIYFGQTNVEDSQPCMFIENKPIQFWFGISKPDKVNLVELNFPILAISVPVYGLPSKSVTIDGYGYINENSSIVLAYS